MTQADLDAQIRFLCEIDQLKEVIRASPILSKARRENSAEHSWHLAMYALTLHPYAPEGTDLERVIEMLLVHDIIEIYAGDAPLHGDYDKAAQAAKELAAADQVFAMLPPRQGAWLRAIWDEFEAAETTNARFAKALDRLQPVVQNLETGGGTWDMFDVTEEQVMTRVGPWIEGGAPELWAYIRPKVQAFFAKG